ncbi:hypothetical protein [Streptomyces sp. NPDC008317]
MVNPAPSGTAVVIVERGTGDNSTVVAQGANLPLPAAVSRPYPQGPEHR